VLLGSLGGLDDVFESMWRAAMMASKKNSKRHPHSVYGDAINALFGDKIVLAGRAADQFIKCSTSQHLPEVQVGQILTRTVMTI
jgi:hypothetical protein